MAKRDFATLLTGGDFFEGPRWHDGLWWVSDFYQHAVTVLEPTGEVVRRIELDDRPSGLGWLPDGSLVVSAMLSRKVLRVQGDTITTYADLGAVCGGLLNDLVVDRHGHVFVGDFGYDLMTGEDPAPTTLKRIDLDGSVHVVADGLNFPNGAVITPDGATLLVCETFGNRVAAFDLAPDGSLSNHRVWAALGPPPSGATMDDFWAGVIVTFDGCALDAEGLLWAADTSNGRVLRVREGGEVAEELLLPDGLGAFACALGGLDGRTLLICAAPDYIPEARTGAKEGVLLTVNVDVPGAPAS